MISLDPINIDNAQLTKQVFDGRDKIRKNKLNSVFPYVTRDYRVYKINKTQLEGLTPDSHITGLRDDMEYCYKSAKEFNKIKSDIYNNVPTKRDRCLYCCITTADTLDHYVNKAEFPEYSILTDNLIPCCSKCNEKKKVWREGNKRVIINNYFDDLIKDDYLYIDVGFSKNKIPFIKSIKLDFDNVFATKEQIELVKNHYDKLDLINRYLDPATNCLSRTVDKIRGMELYDKMICEALLKSEIKVSEKNYGSNNWETAVYKGILKNTELVEWLSTEHRDI